jgi:carboxyl-terminal processing protease
VQTFGKGSVQTILPLPNNQAVKLTTARYYTPGGRSIQAKGISADIVVEDEATKVLLREADLQHHLSVEDDPATATAAAAAAAAPANAKKPVEKVIAGPAAGHSAAAVAAIAKGKDEAKKDETKKDEAKKDEAKKDDAKKDAKRDDIQLAAALAHLKGLPIIGATTTTASVAK